MDAEAVPQHLVRQVVQQGVVLPSLFVILQSLFPTDEGDFCHIGQCLDLRLDGPSLLLRIVLVNIGQHLILRLQVTQHMVQVHRQQREGAHNQQTGHDHTHSGKGHEAVGENGVEPLAKIISRVKLSRHCSTHPFRR